MNLSLYIDEKLDRDCDDIIYQDMHGSEIELDPFQVELSDVIEVKYHKIAVIKIKKRPKWSLLIYYHVVPME
jgi:hypothetical protein